MVERTHRLKDDLNWLPPSVRRTRKVVTGTVWGLTATGLISAIAIAPGWVGVLWKGVTVASAGAMVAGERIWRTMLRSKLRQLAAGEIELASLDETREGELIVVEGVIEAENTLRGVITDAQGVYRRMIFDPKHSKYVHEAAVDFALIDREGNRILVEAAGARWMTPMRELVRYPRARFDQPDTPAAVKALLHAAPHVDPTPQSLDVSAVTLGNPRRGTRPDTAGTVDAIEDVLAPGTRVQVVGYKTASADITGHVVDYRLPPQRATLRSGPTLPLVITAVQDLHR